MASFKTFCGCMSLRTGCLVIGALDIILLIGFEPSLLHLVQIFSSGALIFGVVKKKRDFFWPYLIVHSLSICVLTMMLILWIIFAAPVIEILIRTKFSAQHDNEVLNVVVPIVTAVLIIFVIIHGFLLSIVFSHFVELRENEEDQEHPYSNASTKLFDTV